MTFKWSGVFTRGDERKTFKFSFMAVDESAASTVITDYVTSLTAQGWKMESNEVKVGK